MSVPVILTGTDREETPKRTYRAGPLEATYDAGALRWIRWNGVEILRAIMFLVRTPGWGTPAPTLDNLSVEEDGSAFRIRYDAYYSDAGKGVLARISLEGTAAGSLAATADIRADVPFETNRSGFVVLHPLVGFAGTEVAVEHASGPERRLTIPLAISPGQPVRDIRAITHHPRPGLAITTRFDGDVFEMEDHRNWSDASFKTYSRPIGLPYPYLLTPDEPVSQAVTVSIRDEGDDADIEAPVSVPRIDRQSMPAFALPLDSPGDVTAALRFAQALAAIKPQSLLLRHDFARGDTMAEFADLAELLRLTEARLEVVAILPGADAEMSASQLIELSDAFAKAGIGVARIAAFAGIDEQSFQPGEDRPPHLSETDISAALARAFPDSRRGGGTPAFFTELNRKRPDPALADYLTFATTPVVHAADDASVVETLQSLPHILHAAQALSGGRPLAVGPVGIGARLNPYGAVPVDNDPRDREGMAARDPRQRGLFAAAWHVGYLARLCPWNVERLAFGAPTGAFGLLSTRQPYARPFWDEHPEGAAYPLYHVARWIAAAAGGRVLSAGTDAGIARVTWEKSGRTRALFANLGTAPLQLDLGGHPAPHGQLLDADSAAQAALQPDAFAIGKALPQTLTLGPYAVLHIEEGAIA